MIFLITAALVPSLGTVVRAADVNYQGSYDLTFDETTTQELRQWAAIFWQWYDTGVIPPEAECFQFTNPDQFPPGFHPFNEAEALFLLVYSDRIEAARLVAVGGHYGVWNLLQDDPDILAQFRLYTLTGALPVGDPNGVQPLGSYPPTIGPLLYMQLLPLAQMEAVKIKKVCPAGHTEPISDEQLPDWLRGFNRVLRQLVAASQLAEAAMDALYDEDICHWWPWSRRIGFDCDDFADALAGWLLNRIGLIPGVTVEQLRVSWANGKIGHVMTIVTHGGYYWIIDAQTGLVRGPFPVGTPVNPREIVEIGYELQPGDTVIIKGTRPVGERSVTNRHPGGNLKSKGTV